MKLINSILYLDFADMLAAGISERTLKSWDEPVKIADPADKRTKLFAYELLADKYKEAITSKFGNVYDFHSNSFFQQYLQTDAQALAFYKNYRTGSNKYLPRNEKDEKKDYPQSLTKAASWMNLFIAITDKQLPVSKEQYAALRANNYQNFRTELEKKQVRLPYSYVKLLAKKNKYQTAEGINYAALIPDKLENQNSKKLKGDAELLIKQLYGQNKVDMHSVAMRVNMFAQSQGLTLKNGKPLTITAQTAANNISKHRIQLDVMRNGEKSWHAKYRPIIGRERPSAPLFMVAHDGWTVELYFRTDDENGKTEWNRKVALVVVDPFNDYPLGFAMGDTENKELMKEAYRNAFFHIRQLTGAYHMPWQLKCDNFGLDVKHTNDLAQFYISMLPTASHLTPIEPGNSQDNPVESFFNRLNHSIQEKYSRWNWSGRGLKSAEQNQANREFLVANRHEFPTEAEMMVQFLGVINEIREQKREEWLTAFESTPAEDKRIYSREQVLENFGVERSRPVALSNRAINPVINGKEFRFMLLDEDFYQYFGSSFRIKYDPYDMSDVLCICEQHRVQYVVPELVKSKMALKDMREGDRIHLNRMLGFRKALQENIVAKNGAEYAKVMNLPMNEAQAIAMQKVMPTIEGQQKGILRRAEELLKGNEPKQIAAYTPVAKTGTDGDDSIYDLM